MEDIAQAAHILNNLNALNDYAKVHGCKQATTKLRELNSDQLHSPSVLYFKAEIYRMYGCTTLSGVAKDIEKYLSITAKDYLADESLDQIYFAYLLQENAQLYGTQPSDVFDKVIEKVAKTWIKDFNPTRWDLKVPVQAQEGDDEEYSFSMR